MRAISALRGPPCLPSWSPIPRPQTATSSPKASNDGMAPQLNTEFLALEGARARQLIEATTSTIENAVERLRAWSTAKVLLHSFPVPASRALGILDAGRPDGQTSAFRVLDDRLRAI